MSFEDLKVVVAHPFQQHSFHTATAFQKAGCLFKYITTVYNKPKTLTRFFSRFLSKNDFERAKRRKSEDLPDNKVCTFSEFASLFLLFLQRADKHKKLYQWWYWRVVHKFNKKVFKFVVKNRIDYLVVYDTLSGDLIKKVKATNIPIKIIVDMSAAYFGYAKQEYKSQSFKASDFFNQNQMLIDSFHTTEEKEALLEIRLSDYFYVASEFTKKSLIDFGVDDKRIFKCPYGFEHGLTNVPHQNSSHPFVKCFFCGSVSMEKGAHILFEAIEELKGYPFEFHFYGHYDKNDKYFAKMKDSCIFHGHVLHQQLLEEMWDFDVLIFPSVSDGFGLTVIEALSRENVVIVSNNTGVSEFITKDIGFVIDNDSAQIVDSLLFLLKNKETLDRMKTNAGVFSRIFNWDAYNKSVANTLLLMGDKNE